MFLFLQTKPSFFLLGPSRTFLPFLFQSMQVINLYTYTYTYTCTYNISKCTGRENTSEKCHIKFLSFQICVVTITNLPAPSCLCLCSFCFGDKFTTMNFELYRQKPLAGKKKENSQILIRTFTCRSTFLDHLKFKNYEYSKFDA